MKTILVPTDFSPVAENAACYAAEIAKLSHAKLILFHAYHVPVIATEIPAEIVGLGDLEAACLEGLKRIERKLHHRYGKDLTVKCICKCGFAVEEINDYASKHKASLIVMGMQGTGYLGEKLIGSITTSLIQKSTCPVLAIDKTVRFKSIKKIVFACDYLKTENTEVLEPLKEFVRIFNSHVYVLNVVRELETVYSADSAASDFRKLKNSLADIDHSFHYLQNEEIADGINEFIDNEKMDMVVMIPRKHSLLRNIFIESNTKKMAFHSTVPLLALH